MKKYLIVALTVMIAVVLTSCSKKPVVTEDELPKIPESTSMAPSYTPYPIPTPAAPAPSDESITHTSFHALTPTLTDDIDFAVYSEGVFCIFRRYDEDLDKSAKYNLRDGIPYPYTVKDAEEFITATLSAVKDSQYPGWGEKYTCLLGERKT